MRNLVLSMTIALLIGLSTEKPKDVKIEGVVVGIDLGTTYSCVGIYKNGRVEILQNEFGNRITPSFVGFTEDGERLVGEAAKNQATQNPKGSIYAVKRLIGRKFTEKEVQQDKKILIYDIENKDQKPFITVTVNGEKKQFAPEEISAMILKKMKEIAESALGREVNHAVVTVPAYFNDAQRQATKDAGIIAGLNVVRTLNEPTAAAIAYGLDKKEGEKNILVFDLGGGTFDVSILTVDKGFFEVISTFGDTHLGGEDFDNRVLEYFSKLFKRKHNKDFGKDLKVVTKLKVEIEKAKRDLSSKAEVTINIKNFFEGIDFSQRLTRAKFEELNADLFKKTLAPIERVMSDSGFKKTDIDEIILVGGSTRIPKIQQLVKDYFNGKEISRGVNPDEAVAYGAAVQAGVLSNEDGTADELVIVDVTPLTMGIETVGGVMTKIISKDAVIPTKKSQTFTTYQDNQEQVTISVYEGERPMVKDNHLLGQFNLGGIPAAPRGTPQIEVTFELDQNGILTVTAKDTAQDKEESITITGEKGRLTPEEIEQMIKDAEKFEDSDKLVKEKVDARNALDSYLYSMRNTIEDKEKMAEKMSQEDKDTIKAALDEHQEWMTSNPEAEKEDYDDHKKDLETVCNPIIAKYYQQGGQGGPGGSATGGGAQPDDEAVYDDL